MMNSIQNILMAGCLLAVAACSQTTKTEAETVAEAVAEAPAPVVEDLYTPVMDQIGQMAKPTYASSDEFEELFNSILVDGQGNLKPVSDSAAIGAYLNIMEGEADPGTQVPVFEIKDSDHVILLLKEKKAWAHVLLNKNTMTLVDIQFPAGSEIAKLGSNAEKFRQQLNGASLTLTENNFELTPWDDQIEAKGDVVIDGISGATKLCQASVDLLNHQLPLYRNYFLVSKNQSGTQ